VFILGIYRGRCDGVGKVINSSDFNLSLKPEMLSAEVNTLADQIDANFTSR